MEKFKAGDRVRCLVFTRFSDDTAHFKGEVVYINVDEVAYYNNENNSYKYELVEQ